MSLQVAMLSYVDEDSTKIANPDTSRPIRPSIQTDGSFLRFKFSYVLDQAIESSIQTGYWLKVLRLTFLISWKREMRPQYPDLTLSLTKSPILKSSHFQDSHVNIDFIHVAHNPVRSASFWTDTADLDHPTVVSVSQA